MYSNTFGGRPLNEQKSKSSKNWSVMEVSSALTEQDFQISEFRRMTYLLDYND